MRRRRAAQPRSRRESELATREERYRRGKRLRSTVSRASHGGWEPPRKRRDPVEILIESSSGRIPRLIPIRYGRMLRSPFAFFRGAAAIMAEDLAATPRTDVRVQACGDCHLLNFGGFATPERQVIFDINDFDETLPAPWEWDVKRLAASVAVAARNNRFATRDARAAARAAVREYRTRMAALAAMSVLEVWYTSVSDLLDSLADADLRKWYQRTLRKERRRDPTGEFSRLAHTVRGEPRISDDPPLVYHLPHERDPAFWRRIHRALTRYRETLSDDRRVLYDRFRLCDLAFKVVGVGSVGTGCAIALFVAAEDDPLFLQIKEARRSVLEPFAGKSRYENHGERVVAGQRLMQSASDIFLGWTALEGRHYYVRQLRDMKIRPAVEIMKPPNLVRYAEFCGRALAHAHARAGDAALLAGYMGKRGAFENAVADFAVAYADQNDRDYAALVAAVRSGRVEARMDE